MKKKDRRKGPLMHAHIDTQAALLQATPAEISVTERGELTQHGCTAEEIVSFLWLRQWYQAGGSDRVALVHCWEFLKFLVTSGRIEP